MAKADLGVKRQCQGCDAKFYDLGRTPITCPKCGAVFKVEAPRKSTRAARSAVAVATRSAVAVKKDPVEVAKIDADAPEKAKVADGDGDKDPKTDGSGANDVMEDTSELGEDADDVAEVVEGAATDEKEDV